MSRMSRWIAAPLVAVVALLAWTTADVGGQATAPNAEWTTYGGDLASRRYRPFDQMPNVDGFEATMLIRAFERTAGAPRLPIVALTAHAMPRDRQRCFDAGMDGYLPKPLRSADLFAEIERVVRTDPRAESGLPEPHQNAVV